jgi:hypothetical protein
MRRLIVDDFPFRGERDSVAEILQRSRGETHPLKTLPLKRIARGQPPQHPLELPPLPLLQRKIHGV